ncbi:4-coumarate--CoA ligase 1 isoform X2 [Harpegnathos saltator]|uniref:4-coumarate--CoA ligase 1 isoform X2 n=1 Tax=Harpegnathos saltator TaxID=610380 RepID=UPI000DBEE89D|nr:4-coumarate--CoA ligase 1 isoform X2 [Harpegnathos saltator]
MNIMIWIIYLRKLSETSFIIARTVSGKLLFIDEMFANTYHHELKVLKPKKVIIMSWFAGLVEFISYEVLEIEIDSKYNQRMVDHFRCVEVDEYRKHTAAILYTRHSGAQRGIKIPHALFNAPVNEQVFDIFPDGVGMWVGSFSLSINMLLAVYSILSSKRMIRFMGIMREEMCYVIGKHKIDWVLLETQMCVEITNSNMLQKYNLSCLKQIIYSGAEFPYHDYKSLSLSLPNTMIVGLYYTAETGIISCQIRNNKIKSSGHIGKSVKLKIIDFVTKNPVCSNTYGEICCYCIGMAHIACDFYKVNYSTVSPDGWFYTNDIGYYDNDGDIFVMGRKSNLINFKGYYYSPITIENFISRYSAVDKVAVVATKNEQDVDHPTAYILKKPGQYVDAEAVIAEVDAKFDDHMKLRGGIKIVNEMPGMIDGNIDRFALDDDIIEPVLFVPYKAKTS